jgi:hypothetical protein
VAIVDAPSNTIGGFGDDIPGARNVISGNGLVGIVISGAGSHHNRVSGNYIGVGSDGSQPIGNGHNGVHIDLGAHDNTIGGTEPNSGNIIANNGRNGVALAPNAGTGNLIDPNSIFANAMRGITLAETADPDDPNTPPPAPVVNDPDDADTGPNNLQNYPEVTAVNINGNGDVLVTYRVDSLPGNSNYGTNGIYIEFFRASAGSQGELFLGFDHYTQGDHGGTAALKTKNLGNAVTLGILSGDLVTATATDADGNTSEFTMVSAPTAGEVSICGRVFRSATEGVYNARLTLTDIEGGSISVATNNFGYYCFDSVEAGRTYVLSISHKMYIFTPPSRIISVADSLDDVHFIASP